MGKIIKFVYSLVAYVVFLAAFLYAIGFVGNFIVPKSIDSGVETSTMMAILINAGLLGAFAIQHSVMARPGFKTWWAKIIPQTVERNTYVLISSLLLILMFWQWRPMTGVIWDVQNSTLGSILQVIFWMGWVQVLLSSFLINHFDLFGLRHGYLNLKGKEYTHLHFKTTFLYKIVRHPLLLGFIIAFWAAPLMTTGHLLFSLLTTGYIIIGATLEERDHEALMGSDYVEYKKSVPMLIPIPGKRFKSPKASPEAETN